MSKKGSDLSAVLANIEKSLGNKGEPKLHIFSEMKQGPVEVISWGIKELDEASGLGGIPRGRLIELFGPESSGKSYITLKAMASFQKAGLKAGLIDLEKTLTEKWAKLHGVDTTSLVYGDAFSGEEALNYIKTMCVSKALDLIVLDSTAALIPQSEIDGQIGEGRMAALAALMSGAIKQILQAAGDSGTTVIFINQIRMKPGVVYGNPEDTPGGKALKFYAHQRLRVHRIGLIKRKGEGEKEDIIGIKSRVKFEKNKLAPPFVEAEYEMYFSEDGNDPIVNLVQIASKKPYLILKRKKVGEDMRYFWEDEDTECVNIPDVAEWLDANEKVGALLDAVEAKTTDLKLKLPEEVTAIRTKLQTPPAETQVVQDNG
jgi:recombination protein RecA